MVKLLQVPTACKGSVIRLKQNDGIGVSQDENLRKKLHCNKEASVLFM